MNVVVSYDISEDKRRTKIHNVLKSYGQWMQYSVFECQLTDTQYAKLRSRLNKLIKPDTDSVRFYFLCSYCFLCRTRGWVGVGSKPPPKMAGVLSTTRLEWNIRL